MEDIEDGILAGIKSKEKFFYKLYGEFVALSDSLVNSTNEDWESNYGNVLKELDECELITKKARLVFDACEADEQLHHRLKTEKQDAIESVKSEIEGLKQELERAKTDRKNNEEYVQFARKVNEQRTRPDLTNEIMVVEGEIAELDAELLSFQQTYDFRAKQVKLLVAALQQLEADFDLDKLAQDIERDKPNTEQSNADAMQVDGAPS